MSKMQNGTVRFGKSASRAHVQAHSRQAQVNGLYNKNNKRLHVGMIYTSFYSGMYREYIKNKKEYIREYLENISGNIWGIYIYTHMDYYLPDG